LDRIANGMLTGIFCWGGVETLGGLDGEDGEEFGGEGGAFGVA